MYIWASFEYNIHTRKEKRKKTQQSAHRGYLWVVQLNTMLIINTYHCYNKK